MAANLSALKAKTLQAGARQPAGIVLGIVLALAAAALFGARGASAVGAGSLLLLAGMAVFAWAAPALAGRGQASEQASRLELRLGVLLLAAAAYLISLLLAATGEETWPVRLLWLAGMVCLAAAFAHRQDMPALSRLDGRDWLLLSGIAGLGFFLRFWRLPDLPAEMHGDVASMGLEALRVLGDGGLRWFGNGWADMPMLEYVMMAASMRVFGPDLFGLSLTAVMLGVVAIGAAYLLGREMFGRTVGLLAAFFLTISYTHIHFSRIVIYGSPAPFMTLALFFLLRGVRTDRPLWWVLGGITFGLTLQTYAAGRISIVVIGLLFLRLILSQRKLSRPDNWLLFALAALAAYGPMLIFALQNPHSFIGRADTVGLNNPAVMTHLMGKYQASGAAEVLLEQAKRSFLTFHLYGDGSTHFSFRGPMVDVLTATLMALGLGFCLRWWRDSRCLTLATWLLGALALGSVLTNDAPFWPHLIVLLPAVALLAGLGAERAWSGLAPMLNRRNQRLVALAFIALLLFAGWRNWTAYYQHVADNATARVRAARFIRELPSDHLVYVISNPFTVNDREFAFYARGVELEEISAEALLSEPVAPPTQPTIYLATTNHGEALATLQKQFPQAETTEVRTSGGFHEFTVMAVRPVGADAIGADAIGADAIRPYSLADVERSRGRRVWLAAVIAFTTSLAAGAVLYRRRPRQGQAVMATPHIAESALEQVQARSEVSPNVPDTEPIKAPSMTTALHHRASQAAPRHDIAGTSMTRVFAGMAGVISAILIAYLAQRLFDFSVVGDLVQGLANALSFELNPTNRLRGGGLLYVAAMILFALAALPLLAAQKAAAAPHPRRRVPGPHRPDAVIVRPEHRIGVQAAPSDAAPPRTTYRWRQQLALLALALAPYLASMLLFVIQGENALVRGLWLAGIALFVAGQVLWPALQRAGDAGAEASPAFRWQHVALLALVLAAAAWLRMYRLETIPSDFHGDMASHGLQARDILLGQEKMIFREGWANIPMMAFLPSVASLSVFGNDLFGLNMASALGGLLMLLGVYLLTWRLFDRHRPALLATAVLAINTPHIHFSRIAEYMDPWPFILFGLFWLVDGLKGRRPQSLAAAGVMLAAGFMMYYSGRVIAPVLVVSLLYVLLVRRAWLRHNGLGIALMVLAALVVVGPNLIYFARNWEAFAERSRSVFLFYPPVMEHLFGKYGVDTVGAVVLEQIKRSVLMFHHSIDSSTQFGYPRPMFSALVAPLVALGFGFSLRHWRHPGLGLTAIWVLTIMVFGSILTNNAPFWPRLVGILAGGAILAAVALDRIWEGLLQLWGGWHQGGWHPPLRRRSVVDAVLGIAALAFIAFAGWQGWQHYSQTVENNARPQARMGRYLYTLPPEIAACSFADPYELRVRETYFLAWPRTVLDLPADAPDGLIDRCPGPPFVWLLYPNQIHRLPALQARWPGGQVAEHRDRSGALVFTSYVVADAAGTGTDRHGPAQTEIERPAQSEPGASAAFLPDGALFQPEHVFLGDTNATTWTIQAGRVSVSGGEFTLQVGPVAGHDAVYDYVELRAVDGSAVYRFEAEDASVTSGDTFSDREGPDGHWWLQNYGPFSGGQGLVAQKSELVPVLTTTVQAPDGLYDLLIGSFTGDPANGVFGLSVRWQ